MNYLSVENLGKNYGERVLFEGLTFGLSQGDKMALIANNGTGKSSMLKIIAGADVSDEGSVTLRNGIRTGYLSQEPNFDNSLTIEKLITESQTEITKLIKEYEQALINIEKEHNSHNNKSLEELTAKMDKVNAWDYERRIKQILSKFNINDLSQEVGDLSGGQKKRLSLALLLLDEPELLLLDEPTNHLDVEMIEWLEKYLQQQKITLLMVTHDRYFLDRVCNHILELEDGKLFHHSGNYAYFLEKRAEREAIYDTDLSKAGKLMKKELEWMRRSPKARTTKSKARITNFEIIKEKASNKKVKHELNLEIKMSRIGGKILELKKVYKSYDDLKILNGFDYTFKKGERIGIVGKNGVGKSTFLNILTGLEKPDSGKVNIGETIVYGYFSQKGIQLKEDKRVIDSLKEIAEVIIMANGSKVTASQMLTHFMFPPKTQHTFVSKLSGGEKRRLYLLMVLMKNPNFLILDEPTNDLDLLTLNKLEEFLLQFSGCLIIVSHDRYFMDKLTDHLFVFKGEGIIKDEYCSYSEYREKQLIEEKKNKDQAAQIKLATVDKEVKKTKKISFKDKFEYEQLEKEIELLEMSKKKLEEELVVEGLSFQDINKKSDELGKVILELDEKTMRWLELDELM
ncbi:MAG: ABC-F family ATP-binding cassette domain-containing protein [Flavobacteriales bacterium]|jgi:ATP-binding cassette subfamily F protein uup|nr:ABC-F family ATP-binding cassette domain-containing protein [Flavobacteriales bacterium]